MLEHSLFHPGTDCPLHGLPKISIKGFIYLYINLSNSPSLPAEDPNRHNLTKTVTTEIENLEFSILTMGQQSLPSSSGL